MSLKRFSCIGLFLIVLSLLVSPLVVNPAAANSFGPETFVRETGSPVAVEHAFTASRTDTTMLTIHNGIYDDEPTGELVSNSIITLNGIIIVGPENFNQNVEHLELEVTLQEGVNTLIVELRGKPGGVITLTISDLPDITPPVVTNQNPAPNVTNVPVDTNVAFDVDDDASGVDLNTLNVTIGSDDAVVNGIVQTGYSETIIVDDGAGGYDVRIDPDIDFGYGQEVNVVIDASDLASNTMPQVSYSFTCMIGDTTPPEVSNCDPCPGQVDVPLDADIYFDIKDPLYPGYSGVDDNTLTVAVEGEYAILNGEFQTGFTGNIISDDVSGFYVTIDPDEVFGNFGNILLHQPEVVDVSIEAFDNVGNVMAPFSYSFTGRDPMNYSCIFCHSEQE